jgi:hypothetical protein
MVFFVCAVMRVSEGLQPMLHNIVLVILGLVLIALLTAIFETLGLKNHPYVARIWLLCVSSLWHMAAGDTTLGGRYCL